MHVGTVRDWNSTDSPVDAGILGCPRPTLMKACGRLTVHSVCDNSFKKNLAQVGLRHVPRGKND